MTSIDTCTVTPSSSMLGALIECDRFTDTVSSCVGESISVCIALRSMRGSLMMMSAIWSGVRLVVTVSDTAVSVSGGVAVGSACCL